MNTTGEKAPLLFERGASKFYEDGSYVFQEEDCPPMKGGAYEYFDIVSAQFNQLKAKVFNLIEASVTDKTQQEAMKGLFKGFANEHYKATVDDLQYFLFRIGIVPSAPTTNLWTVDPLGSAEQRN